MQNVLVSSSTMRRVRSLITTKHTVIQIEVKPKNQHDYFIHLYKLKSNSAKQKTVLFELVEEINLDDVIALCCACFLINLKQAQVAYQKSKNHTSRTFNPIAWVADSNNNYSTNGPLVCLNGFQNSAGTPTPFLSDLQRAIEKYEGFCAEKETGVVFPISYAFCSILMNGKAGDYIDTIFPIQSPLASFFEQFNRAKKANDGREKRRVVLSFTSKYRKVLGENFNSHANATIWAYITLLEEWELSEKFYIEILQNDPYFNQHIARSYEIVSEYERRYSAHLYLQELSQFLPNFSEEKVCMSAIIASFPATFMRMYLLSFLNRYTPDADRQHEPLFRTLPLEQCGFGFADKSHQNRHIYALLHPENAEHVLDDMHRLLNPKNDPNQTTDFIEFLGDLFKRANHGLNMYQSRYEYTERLSFHFDVKKTLPLDHASMALYALTGDHDAKRSATQYLSGIDAEKAGQYIYSPKLIGLWMEFYNKSPFDAMQLPSISEEDKRWLVEKLN